jgi:hypothetical protein
MAHLTQRRVVHCPFTLARGYLSDDLTAKAASGEAGVMTLSVNAGPLDISKRVAVTFRSDGVLTRFEQPWHLHWTPSTKAYPEFDGELTVRADETYATARLELSGSYHPPGGPFGAVFDWFAGHRLATKTAQSLLERLGSQMEGRYVREEAEKKRERDSIQ